jgi:hypothetical protein
MGVLAEIGVLDRSRLIRAKPIGRAELASREYRLLYNERFDSKSAFTATLYFLQSQDRDRPDALWKIDASVRQIDDDSFERSQSFYINKNEPFYTLRETYNLLQGRYVLKDLPVRSGGIMRAWIQLDFEHTYFSGNYATNLFRGGRNYDIGTELQKEFPDKKIDPVALITLANSLEQGNRELATVRGKNGAEWVYVQANPKDRKIDILRPSE